MPQPRNRIISSIRLAGSRADRIFSAPGARRLLAIFVAVELLASCATLGYRWLISSTPVSASRAVQQFRQAASFTPTPSPKPLASTTRSAKATPTPSPSGRTTPSPSATPSVTPSARPTGTDARPPTPGVYSWATTGSETASGITRDFPSESQRITTVQGKTYFEHDIYSDQHEEWYDFEVSDSGITCSRYRANVRLGPFSKDITILFNPPVRFSLTAHSVGQQWQGTWQGDTSGNYSARTFEHTTLRIGSENVDVWGVEVRMHLEGEVTGDVTFSMWSSPKYHMTMKEHFVMSANSGGLTYEEDVTITLLSAIPQQ